MIMKMFQRQTIGQEASAKAIESLQTTQVIVEDHQVLIESNNKKIEEQIESLCAENPQKTEEHVQLMEDHQMKTDDRLGTIGKTLIDLQRAIHSSYMVNIEHES